MNKEYIQNRINELAKTSGTNTGWHQRIELAEGVFTTDKRVTTTELWNEIYQKLMKSENICDKSILDIGCNAGLFCYEASKKGAKVFGVESKIEWFNQAIFVRNILNGNYTLINGYADDIEYEDVYFEYIFLISVLRYIGTDKFGFKKTKILVDYQIEFIEMLSKVTNNFIMKVGIDKWDNIDFWSNHLKDFGFVEDSRIIAYPDVPRARQDRFIVRFKKI